MRRRARALSDRGWDHRLARVLLGRGVLGCATVTTGFIVASASATPPTIAMLAYAGALFTATYGVSQIVAGE